MIPYSGFKNDVCQDQAAIEDFLTRGNIQKLKKGSSAVESFIREMTASKLFDRDDLRDLRRQLRRGDICMSAIRKMMQIKSGEQK